MTSERGVEMGYRSRQSAHRPPLPPRQLGHPFRLAQPALTSDSETCSRCPSSVALAEATFRVAGAAGDASLTLTYSGMTGPMTPSTS